MHILGSPRSVGIKSLIKDQRGFWRIMGPVGSATPAAWTPADITGCKLWLRSDLGITITGSGVATWADQSGNGTNLLQAVDGARPTYQLNQINTYPCLRFDGIASNMQTAASVSVGGKAATLFMVLKQITWADQASITDGGTTNSVRVAQRSASPQFNFLWYGTALRVPATNMFSTLAWELFTMRFPISGVGSMYVNAAPKAFTAAGAGTFTLFTLGCLRDGAAFYANFDVAEVIVYNGVLALADYNTVVSYLNTRYVLY